MSFSGRKLLIAGLILTLLIGIPLTVYLVGQQQNNQSHAAASTTLSFTPTSTQQAPILHNVGDTIPLDIMVDPGKNVVPVIKLDIVYDPAALSVDKSNGFQPNKQLFPTYPQGLPTYSPGHVTVQVSTVGTQLGLTGITQPSKIGTLTFKALAPVSSTQITFSQQSAAYSTGPNESAGENVLLPPEPAYMSIGSSTTPTGPAVTQAANESPICTALNVDRTTSGTAPFSVTFTAIGNDPDGTITKATYNFGDGPTKDVTTGGTIGTQSISAQIAHTYNNPGTFPVSVILTDNRGGISSGTACQKTITVTAATQGTGTGTGVGTGVGTGTGVGSGSAVTTVTGAGTGTGVGTGTTTTVASGPTAAPAPITTLPKTGPGDKFVIAGSAVAVITLIGGILFLAL